MSTGDQQPSWPSPHQQQGFPQQGYQQGGFQQPNPYLQPKMGTPGCPPPGPTPGNGRGKLTLAIVASTALVAAVAVGGTLLVANAGEPGRAAGGSSAGGSAEPSEAGGEGGEGEEGNVKEEGAGEGGTSPDDPRRSVWTAPDPVVADDWQVQTHIERGNSFDVPADDWTVDSRGTLSGFEIARGEDTLRYTLSAPAKYLKNYCGSASWRALVGTTGSIGAVNTEKSATHEAENWALAAFDEDLQGSVEVSAAEPFQTAHGMTGHKAVAKVTGVPADPEDACAPTEGTVVAVSYLDPKADIATWLMIVDTGIDEELDQGTMDTIMNSLRPYED